MNSEDLDSKSDLRCDDGCKPAKRGSFSGTPMFMWVTRQFVLIITLT